MNAKEIREYILDYLKDRLSLLEITEKEINKDFDFVQSGLLDSMAFVDMLTAMEEHFGMEVDFEQEVEDAEFTNLKGLSKVFLKNA